MFFGCSVLALNNDLGLSGFLAHSFVFFFSSKEEEEEWLL